MSTYGAVDDELAEDGLGGLHNIHQRFAASQLRDQLCNNQVNTSDFANLLPCQVGGRVAWFKDVVVGPHTPICSYAAQGCGVASLTEGTAVPLMQCG